MKFLIRLIVVALLSAPAMADPTADAAKAVELGQAAEAEQRWEDAAKHYAEAARLENSFENFNRALEAYFTAGDPASAAPYAEALVDYARSIDDQSMLASKLFDYTNVLLALKAFDKAEPLLREGLPLARGTDLYWSFNNSLASLLFETGRHEQAVPRLQATVENARSVPDKNDPDLAIYLTNLGAALNSIGKFEEAEDVLSEALLIGKKTLGNDHPEYAKRLLFRADSYAGQGRYRKASSDLQKARNIFSTAAGDHRRGFRAVTFKLAKVSENRERYEEADQYYLEALENIVTDPDAEDPILTMIRSEYDRFLAQRPPQ